MPPSGLAIIIGAGPNTVSVLCSVLRNEQSAWISVYVKLEVV